MKRLLTVVLSLFLLGLAFAQDGERSLYVIERDIPYHTEAGEYAAERCKLDFYYPVGEKDFPTVVWFHGGGLTGGRKDIPAGLRDSGLGVIAANYRLLPRATVQECIDDAAAAVAWAFREVASRGGDTTRIFVAGHSAGGYLTDMVVLDKHWLEAYGVDADRIAGAFPYSAQKITHFNVRKELGMGPLQPLIDSTAPLYHVRKLPMPMVVLSGDREMEMNGRYEEQAYFWRMMRLNGNEEVYLYEFDGYDHGGMPAPAHSVVKRYIRHICEGTLPQR
ncbi:MAG: alpha/beta hydrolase [Bacteroidales bacterium]|nr:alpha/beta hydrolase [Bacteroidales bacterium]